MSSPRDASVSSTLYRAKFHPKPKGVGSGVFEIRADYRTDTYRAVYAVKIGERVYVLHCFQKKSRRGIKTSKKDVDLIKRRLRMAQELVKNYEQED